MKNLKNSKSLQTALDVDAQRLKASKRTAEQIGVLEDYTSKYILRNAINAKNPHAEIERVVRLILKDDYDVEYYNMAGLVTNQTCGERFLQKLYEKALKN